MSSPRQAIDHLILFVPLDPATNLPQVPSFFSENFTLTPGGHHADGATSNTLILLADGCYIELISFVNTDLAPDHWWGPDASFTGWKDWCLTNHMSPEENHAKASGTHGEPIKGGRKRADGVDVKWAVTFPRGEKGGQDVRGKVPFFCHDVTPRDVRVPLSEEKTSHPCGATGVHQLTVIVPNQAALDSLKGTYTSILGAVEAHASGEATFHVGHVSGPDVDGDAKVILRLPRTTDEQEKVDKNGFWYGDVVLNAKGKPNGTVERLDNSYGEGSFQGVWVVYV
jgi:hypothetical protein